MGVRHQIPLSQDLCDPGEIKAKLISLNEEALNRGLRGDQVTKIFFDGLQFLVPSVDDHGIFAQKILKQGSPQKTVKKGIYVSFENLLEETDLKRYFELFENSKAVSD